MDATINWEGIAWFLGVTVEEAKAMKLPPTITVDAATWERLHDRINNPRPPTPAMRALFDKENEK